ESRTAAGSAMHLRVALDYSSRAAIATMADGAFVPLPSVDLLVRTGGERRLSDFLLWECAYAELSFIDIHWPDLTARDIDALFEDFGRRERRFGAAPAHLSASA